VIDNVTSQQLFFRLNLAQRVLMKSVDKEIQEKIGVSATQVAALMYLIQHDGCLLVDLSRELLQTKSAITTLVERMERNGFIQKMPSLKDKRASQLFLASKGKDKLKQALPLVASYNQSIMELFRPDELEIVLRFLNIIIDKFETVPDNFFKTKAPFLSIGK
jgi:DNA-binding MarR family transcriptional regulator